MGSHPSGPTGTSAIWSHKTDDGTLVLAPFHHARAWAGHRGQGPQAGDKPAVKLCSRDYAPAALSLFATGEGVIAAHVSRQ